MPELSWLPILGALVAVATAFVLLISPNWKASLVTLAIQYLGVFILVSTGSLIQLALTKLVAGLMAVAVLGMSISSLLHLEGSSTNSSNIVFTELYKDDPGNHEPGGHQFISQRMFRLLNRFAGYHGGIFHCAPNSDLGAGDKHRTNLGKFHPTGFRFASAGFTIQPFRNIL